MLDLIVPAAREVIGGARGVAKLHPRDLIILVLARRGPLTFSELKEETGLPSGALGYHLKQLEGLVEKTREGLYKLTPEGARRARRLQARAKNIPALQPAIEQALEAISRSLARVPFLPAPALGRARRVWGHIEASGPVRLVVQARDGCVRVHETGEGDTIVWEGRAEARASIESSYDPEKHTVTITLSRACIDLTVPKLAAVAAGLDTSSLEVEARSPLRFLTVQADTGRVKGRVPLQPRGGVLASMDTSSGDLTLVPTGPGDYWLELSLDTSRLIVELDGDIPVRVVEGEIRADTSNVRVEEELLNREAPARLEVSGWLDTSSVSIRRAVKSENPQGG